MNNLRWFLDLDACLSQFRPLWQLRPFTQRHCPWQQDNPALARWLQQLTDNQVTELDAAPSALYAQLAPLLPGLEKLVDLTRVPVLPQHLKLAPPPHVGHGVPGRKWEQIRAFLQVLQPDSQPILEWCAGKGHLGRLAAVSLQAPVVSLELDPHLCADARRLAQRQGVDQQVHAVDVLSESALQHLEGAQQALALHACGELHVHLLKAASRNGVARIYLSPCCYHLGREADYRPLSSAGQASPLRLDRQDRQLAVQETVTADQRTRRQRQTEVIWRLGFDLLQRDLRGVDEYLPLPSVRKSMLAGSFADFCAWAATQKQLRLPAQLDLEAYLQRGEQRCREVRRLELVSHLFRRPLELWLVLDRVLYLEEQGYQVRWGQFCERTLTPRNLMIQARLSAT